MNPTPSDTELDELRDAIYQQFKNHGLPIGFLENIKHWYYFDQALYYSMELVQAYTASRVAEARLDELDKVIGLQSKQFSRWTQTDIANFFNGVGKRYRALEATLTSKSIASKEK